MMKALRFAVGSETDKNLIFDEQILPPSDPKTVFGIVLGLLRHQMSPISKLFIITITFSNMRYPPLFILICHENR